MRRWNGWGDDTIDYPLGTGAKRYLTEFLGVGQPTPDVTLEMVVTSVPSSRLPEERIGSHVSSSPMDRVRHARGQSLPDWIALRSGRINNFPDGVAYVDSPATVQRLLSEAAAYDMQIIPYGGGTSVVGHINPLPGAPVLTVSLRRLNRLLKLDTVNMLATFGAGVTGPELEAQLRARGFTLGHFPQSFEFSTLGGWVATRSSGQQSLAYGRIEQLFAGGVLAAPAGKLDMPPYPASAAGPDLRQLILGSEGRLGILTEVTVRVTPLPEHEEFHAVFFPDFGAGMGAVRSAVQARLPLSMLRFSSAEETRTTLALAGHERLISLLETLLNVRGLGEDKCVLLAGFTGQREVIRRLRHEMLELCHEHGGVHAGRRFGEQWVEGRFRTPYLRNTLWELGYAVDTLETATTWDNVTPLRSAIESALRNGLSDSGERVHVFSHLSHVYSQGASIYTTYLFRRATDPDVTLDRWQQLKAAASNAIVSHHGTISHQHGVGLDHREYLEPEKGAIGLAALRALGSCFDPQGIMNPGKLYTNG